MPEMEQCEQFHQFCENATLAEAFPKVCTQDAADGEQGKRPRHERAAAAAAAGGGPLPTLFLACLPARVRNQSRGLMSRLTAGQRVLLDQAGACSCQPGYGSCWHPGQPPPRPSAGSSRSLPPMKMWFHQSTRELFLFKEWVPNSSEWRDRCQGRGFARWPVRAQWCRLAWPQDGD